MERLVEALGVTRLSRSQSAGWPNPRRGGRGAPQPADGRRAVSAGLDGHADPKGPRRRAVQIADPPALRCRRHLSLQGLGGPPGRRCPARAGRRMDRRTPLHRPGDPHQVRRHQQPSRHCRRRGRRDHGDHRLTFPTDHEATVLIHHDPGLDLRVVARGPSLEDPGPPRPTKLELRRLS